MDCNNANFEEVYESIKKHLPTCSFVSMDLELTGIKTADPESILDVPYERYNKLKSAATKYRIIQIGISLFTDVGNNTYEARTYNAYVFPRENFNFSPQIVLDASAIEFNMKHKMNFQKWIYEGVSYTQHHFAKRKRDEFMNPEEEKKDEPVNEIVLTLESDVAKKDSFIKKLDEWLASGSTEPLSFDEQSAFFRKFIYEYIGKNHPKLVAESDFKEEGSKEKVLKVFNLTEEERKEREEKIIKRKMDKLNDAVGFTRVIELLIQEKKPIVGHNCYFDLLFIMHSFIENLPNRYVDFKKRLNLFFPVIYDTKFIAHRPAFNHLFQETGSTLETILARIIEHKEMSTFSKNEIIYPEGFKKYDLFNPTEGAYHEAGFDALLTGYVFIKMFHKIEPETQLLVKNVINVIKAYHCVSIDKEEDIYNRTNPVFIFTKEIEDETRFAPNELNEHFKDLILEPEELRITLFFQLRKAIGLVRLETKDEQKVIAFLKKCQVLKESGLLLENFEDYTKRRTKDNEELPEPKKYEKKGGKPTANNK